MNIQIFLLVYASKTIPNQSSSIRNPENDDFLSYADIVA